MRVVKPVDIKLMRTIHRTIERVLKYGPMFEAAIMDRENQNPHFKFLFDNTVSFFSWFFFSFSSLTFLIVTRTYLLSMEIIFIITR